jgi:hypothetical protein
VIIKDRLIEVDIAEALAIAGKGEKVRCVGDGTGLMTIMDALEGLTFFAPESALAENPEPIKLEVSKDEIAKLAKSAFVPGGVVRYDTPESIKLGIEKFEKEIAKLGSAMLSPGPAHFDTPEARTRAIVDSVERYDEEHGDPPVTKQDAAEDAPKQEASESIPFAGAPSGGALKK